MLPSEKVLMCLQKRSSPLAHTHSSSGCCKYVPFKYTCAENHHSLYEMIISWVIITPNNSTWNSQHEIRPNNVWEQICFIALISVSIKACLWFVIVQWDNITPTWPSVRMWTSQVVLVISRVMSSIKFWTRRRRGHSFRIAIKFGTLKV